MSMTYGSKIFWWLGLLLGCGAGQAAPDPVGGRAQGTVERRVLSDRARGVTLCAEPPDARRARQAPFGKPRSKADTGPCTRSSPQCHCVDGRCVPRMKVFFGLSRDTPIFDAKAKAYYRSGRAAWKKRKGSRAVSEAIRAWKNTARLDHGHVDARLALARAYAFQLRQLIASPPEHSKIHRRRLCSQGWKVSSQALELLSPAFVQRLSENPTEIPRIWKGALTLVEANAAEALYWFAHYHDCNVPDPERLQQSLARVKALGFEPPADARWPETR